MKIVAKMVENMPELAERTGWTRTHGVAHCVTDVMATTEGAKALILALPIPRGTVHRSLVALAPAQLDTGLRARGTRPRVTGLRAGVVTALQPFAALSFAAPSLFETAPDGRS